MPIEDVLPYIGGPADAGEQAIQGTPLQAQTASIAKGLGFSDEVIDRYGDAIGARPRRTSDFLRDFATGFIQNDPEAATRIKTQVRDQFNQQVERKLRIARQKKEEDRQQALFLLDAVKKSQAVGGANGAALLKDIYKQAGMEPTPSIMKMMTDRDQWNQEILEEMEDMVTKGVITTDDFKSIATNPSAYLDLYGALQKVRAQKMKTNKDLLDIEKKKADLYRTQRRNMYPGEKEMIAEELALRDELGPQANRWPAFYGVPTEELQDRFMAAGGEDPIPALLMEKFRETGMLPERQRSTTEGVVKIRPNARGLGPQKPKTSIGGLAAPRAKTGAENILSITPMPDTVGP